MLAITAYIALAMSPGLEQSIDEIVKKQAEGKLKGIAVQVLDNGKPIFTKGYSDSLKIDGDSVFRIGSITKQFTGALILMLQRDKKLSVEDTLGKWIPEVPTEWQGVTIRQLLSHTSGIPSYTSQPGLGAVITKPTKPDGIWQFVSKVKMDFEPGKGWEYNNTAFVILGCVAERAGKAPYFIQLQRRIFDPLKMRHSGEESRHPVVKSFGRDLKSPETLSMDWPYAAGSVVSTVNDLGKWDQALRGTKLFSEAEKEMMFTSDPTAAKYGHPYSFGWAVAMLDGKRIGVDHGGGIPGFSTMITRSLKKNTTVIVLANVEGAPSEKIANEIMQVVEPSYRPRLEAKPDTNVARTQSDKKFFLQLLDGTFDVKRFSDSFLERIKEEQIRDMSAGLAKLGEVSKFEFLTEKIAEMNSRQYRVQIGDQEFMLTITEDAMGKISGMNLRPA